MPGKSILCGLLLLFVHTCFAQVTFVIESLPNATPASDTIFVCGSFNNWVPNDPKYAVQHQLNGQLSVTVPMPPQGKLEYKFTRGSWTKVETNEANAYINNRVLLRGASGKILVKISNWLDLGGARKPDYMVFYFFACGFQGIALCFLIFRIRKADYRKKRALLVLNATLTSLLMLLVLYESVNPILQSYLTFGFQVALFCWAPLMSYFISRFLTRFESPVRFGHLLPIALALVFMTMRLLNIEVFNNFSGNSFLSQWIIFAVIATGFIYNLILFFRMKKQLVLTSSSSDQKLREGLVDYFMNISFASLLLIPVHLLLILMGIHIEFITNFYGVAIAMTGLIFVETYFLWRYPDILKEDKAQTAPSEILVNWMDKLDALMLHAKPYKNPELSVSELADMLGTKSYVLSKIINDSYHKNFRDFVNAYRIKEFIVLAGNAENRHYTFLALAQEVGFNSKSTFNLAFKKFTNKSPSAYFKSTAAV